MAVRNVEEAHRPERIDRRDVIAERRLAPHAFQLAKEARHRSAGKALLDGPRFIGPDLQNLRYREGQATGDALQKRAQSRSADRVRLPLARYAKNAAGIEGKDDGFAALADYVSRAEAEIGDNARVLRGRRRATGGGQFIVLGASGRSRENAGMAMENSSPFSACI
jgi:hypothetical protein